MPPFNKSQIFASIKYFLAWEDYHNFYLAFGASYASWEVGFHKIKGKETLSRSHNNLNTADDDMGLTEPLCIS
jgi:hypothetical protein